MTPVEWAYLIVMIASIVISVALAPRPEIPKAATLQDFEFPQAEEGTPQAVIFGDVWTNGWQVLSYGNLVTEPIQGEGGKK